MMIAILDCCEWLLCNRSRDAARMQLHCNVGKFHIAKLIQSQSAFVRHQHLRGKSRASPHTDRRLRQRESLSARSACSTFACSASATSAERTTLLNMIYQLFAAIISLLNFLPIISAKTTPISPTESAHVLTQEPARICPLPKCEGCPSIEELKAPGIGFALETDHGQVHCHDSP
jgi:hypothetical protein